jgi:hypothetical protein
MEWIILLMAAGIFIPSAKKVFMYAGMQGSAILFTWPAAMEKLENWYGASKHFQKN